MPNTVINFEDSQLLRENIDYETDLANINNHQQEIITLE